jgi:release factor glutamine methyltransferase
MTGSPIDRVILRAEDALEYNGVLLTIPSQVYSPAEDTDLCLKSLIEWAKNAPNNPRILEIGIGPGTLSLALSRTLQNLQKSPQLIGIDINPIAIETARFNAQLNSLDHNFTILQGDLFTPLLHNPTDLNLNSPYDLIIFNPPYLPGEEEIISDDNRQPIDAAWDGGREGDEILLAFLPFVPQFLKSTGDLYFVSSSCVDQTRILATLNAQYLKIIEKKITHIFFEDIILYHVRKE